MRTSGRDRQKRFAALVTDGVVVDGHDESSRALIYVKNADVAMVKILSVLAWKAEVPPTGVHPRRWWI